MKDGYKAEKYNELHPYWSFRKKVSDNEFEEINMLHDNRHGKLHIKTTRCLIENGHFKSYLPSLDPHYFDELFESAKKTNKKFRDHIEHELMQDDVSKLIINGRDPSW